MREKFALAGEGLERRVRVESPDALEELEELERVRRPSFARSVLVMDTRPGLVVAVPR